MKMEEDIMEGYMEYWADYHYNVECADTDDTEQSEDSDEKE